MSNQILIKYLRHYTGTNSFRYRRKYTVVRGVWLPLNLTFTEAKKRCHPTLPILGPLSLSENSIGTKVVSGGLDEFLLYYHSTEAHFKSHLILFNIFISLQKILSPSKNLYIFKTGAISSPNCPELLVTVFCTLGKEGKST